MDRRSAGLWLVTALAIASAPVLAKDMTLAGINFTAPDGWTVQQVDGGLMLTKDFPETADAEQGAAMIQLLAVDAAPAALDGNFQEMVSWVKETASDDPIASSNGQTVGGHTIRVEHRCCDYSKDVSMAQTVVGVAGETQQLLAGLIFVNSSSDHEDEADAAFEALVRSVRLRGDSVDGLQPKEGDGGLEGAYTHLDVGLMPNAFGGVDFNAESAIVVFGTSGLFSDTIPADGDLAAHCAGRPTDCGTYRVSGGGWFGGARTIEMRTMVDAYGVIETQTLPLEQVGDNLVIDDGDYVRVPAFPGGTRFEGSWTYFWASSGMTATTSGSVATEHILALSADGRFRRKGWGGGSTNGDAGGVTVAGKRASTSGTYTIEGYQLTLTDDDGATETLSIFAPEPGSDALLVIDGNNYLKDD